MEFSRRILLGMVPGIIGAASFSRLAAGADKKTVVFVDGIDTTDWDPAVAYGPESRVLLNIYDTLLFYNSESGKLEPNLATEWNVSEDGLSWTFKLRPDVKFHSGETMNAAGLKKILDRNHQGGQGAHYLWAPISEVAAPDDLTLVITTKEPAPIDMIASGQYTAKVYSAASADKGADWFSAGNGDGTGPYKVVQWEKGQQIVLERHADYWRGWEGHEFDRVVVRIVSEVSTQLQMIRSGEADFIVSTLPYDMLDSLQKEDGIEVGIFKSWMNVPANINVKKYPTDNLKFRQALQHIMDYTTVAGQVYGGFATVPEGPVPTALPFAPKLNMPTFDLEKAKALLVESGVPEADWEISWVAYSGNAAIQNIALLFQALAAQIGVKVEIVKGDWGVVWDKQKTLETSAHVYPFRNYPDYATAINEAQIMFRSQDKVLYNLGYYKNDEVDRLIDEAVRLEATDKEAAAKAVNQAYQIVLDEAGALFIADIPRAVAYRSDISGVDMPAAYEAVWFRQLKRS